MSPVVTICRHNQPVLPMLPVLTHGFNILGGVLIYTKMPLICPVCNAGNFMLKHEASYIYSYIIDSEHHIQNGNSNNNKSNNSNNSNNSDNNEIIEVIPFMYDKREQKSNIQYLECCSCGSKYPCFFCESDGVASCKDLQEAIQSETDELP